MENCGPELVESDSLVMNADHGIGENGAPCVFGVRNTPRHDRVGINQPLELFGELSSELFGAEWHKAHCLVRRIVAPGA
jgi:hypothetical protein